ncbi:MAG: hypothetical protein IJ180_09750 [Bacteroidales bacterium]|nr:hypothetical protein [Bacteroidales bacterium]
MRLAILPQGATLLQGGKVVGGENPLTTFSYCSMIYIITYQNLSAYSIIPSKRCLAFPIKL